MRVSRGFHAINKPRFWWHHFNENRFEPDIYRVLSLRQRIIMRMWFNETEKKYSSGEINVSGMTLLHAFVNSSRVTSVVELGRWVGYSSLLLGIQLKRMGPVNGRSRKVVSFDIREDLTKFVDKYRKRLRIQNELELYVTDSRSKEALQLALRSLENKVDLLFIDSDHTYEQAISELNNWYEAVSEGGYIIMHDSSQWATSIGSVTDGGVKKAIHEFFKNKSDAIIELNSDSRVHPNKTSIYPDGCGLTIIQKK